jgi:hypothetical protein
MIALAESRLQLGQTKLCWHEKLLGVAARASQHEGRRGQDQGLESVVAVELDLALEQALEQEQVLGAGQALQLIVRPRLRLVSRVQQHEGRRGQVQESEREWVLGQEQGEAWACLRVTRSSEHECGEFRRARTSLQECECVLVVLVVRPSL